MVNSEQGAGSGTEDGGAGRGKGGKAKGSFVVYRPGCEMAGKEGGRMQIASDDTRPDFHIGQTLKRGGI